MTIPFEHDRMAQLLMARDYGVDADIARTALERASILVTTDMPGETWVHAALQAMASAGTRMFRGGVFIDGIGNAPLATGATMGWSLRRILLDLGCRDRGMPLHPFRIHLGTRSPGRVDLFVMADGWNALVSPNPLQPGHEANAVAGAMAGALAISEAFRKLVLDDLLACRRLLQLSAWDPANPAAGHVIDRLPRSLWQLGLGNLGQAALFVLSLLPFPDRRDTVLLLQDMDRSGDENRLTQILTGPAWIGRKKARAAADYADAAGFTTVVEERAFHDMMRLSAQDPLLVLVGVDNLDARRFAAKAGFGLMIDAGLGRSAEEIFDIRLHAFPGKRSPDEAWPVRMEEPEVLLNPGLDKLVREGRIEQCGALTLAGQSQGVPSTALVAACLQVGQMCRALSIGQYADFVDLTLVNPEQVAATSFKLPDGVSLPMLTVA